HDEDGLEERGGDLVDGVFDVARGVVGDGALHAGGELAAEGIELVPYVCNHLEGVGVGAHPHAHEHGTLAREAHRLVVALGPQLDVGDLGETHQGVAFATHHQLLKARQRAEIGGGGEVGADEGSLRFAYRGEEVVGGQGPADVGPGDPEGGHPPGAQPGPDGEGPPAEDVGALDAVDGGQARLHDADEVIGELIVFEDVGAKAQIHRGDLRVGGLDGEGGDLRLGREIGAHL